MLNHSVDHQLFTTISTFFEMHVIRTKRELRRSKMREQQPLFTNESEQQTSVLLSYAVLLVVIVRRWRPVRLWRTGRNCRMSKAGQLAAGRHVVENDISICRDSWLWRCLWTAPRTISWGGIVGDGVLLGTAVTVGVHSSGGVKSGVGIGVTLVSVGHEAVYCKCCWRVHCLKAKNVTLY